MDRLMQYNMQIPLEKQKQIDTQSDFSNHKERLNEKLKSTTIFLRYIILWMVKMFENLDSVPPHREWQLKSIGSQIGREIIKRTGNEWRPYYKMKWDSHYCDYRCTQFFHGLTGFLVNFFWLFTFHSCMAKKFNYHGIFYPNSIDHYKYNIRLSTNFSNFLINSKNFGIFKKIIIKMTQLFTATDDE